MPTFTPPVRQVSYLRYGTDAAGRPFNQGPARDLFRFLAINEGVTVYKLVDDSYTQAKPADEATIAITYQGGRSHPIDSAEAAALTAAGYGANIT